MALAASLAGAPAASAITIEQQRYQVRLLEDELIGVQSRAEVAVTAERQARERLDRLRRNILANRAELGDARADHTRAQRILSERVVAIYREDRPTTVELILSAGSLSKTLATHELMDRIGVQDALVVGTVNETRDRIARVRRQLLVDRRRAGAARVTATARRRQLQDLVAERQAVLVRSEQTLTRLIAEEQARQAAAREAARIAALQAAQARARAAIAAARVAATPSDGSTTSTTVAPSPVYVSAPPSTATPGTLDSIANCESGGNPRAVSPGGAYRGKYQFDPATWRAVGGRGDPAAAPEGEQDHRAGVLYSQRGSAPWPICGQ